MQEVNLIKDYSKQIEYTNNTLDFVYNLMSELFKNNQNELLEIIRNAEIEKNGNFAF